MHRPLTTVLVALLLAACNGGDQLGEPWGSPMQHSTRLADTPYPPRDLAMFDGVNGRVVMWADLMRLTRRTSVLVIDTRPDDRGAVAMRNALLDDVRAGFSPVAEIECGDDLDGCALEVDDALAHHRRVVVLARGTAPLPDVARAINRRCWFTGVTTLATVPSAARFLRTEDRDRGDVVAYTAPTRALAPQDAAPAASTATPRPG